MRGVDADGVAGLECRSLREEQGQPGHAGLDDRIDVGIAGDDISQSRLRRGLDGEIVAGIGARRPGGQCRGEHCRAHERERQCGGRHAPSEQRRDAGAEHGDDDGVDQEQSQCPRQQHAAQVARFGVGVAGVARAQGQGVERRDTIGGRERIHRQRTVGRAVEARRMFRCRAVAEVGGQRLGGRGRRPERAETVEDMQRRHGLGGCFAGDARAGIGCIAGHVDNPPQHLDEGAGHRQIGPAHVGADMKQGHDSLAAMLARHQRRSVFQRGPALRRQYRIRFGEHLPVDGDVLRHPETCERSVGGEGGEMLRLFPGQAAAEAAAAAAQFDGHQIVIGLRQAGSSEAHQHAALLDPRREAFADFGRQRSDVGKDDHRQLLVEELRDDLLRRALVAQPDIGERPQRAGEVECRCQQRLRGVAGRSADDADRAPAPALVQKLHRAGGSFAGDFEPGNVVAQLDRKIERGLGLAILRREGVAGLADRRALLVERAHQARFDAATGAKHLHGHLRRGVFGSSQGQRRRRAAFINRQRAIADGFAQGFEKLRPAPGIDAIRQPCDFAIPGCLEEPLDGGEGFDPFDRIGLWRQLAQRHPCGAAGHDRDVAGRLRQRHQRHAAAVVVGVRNQFVGRLDPGVPARGRTPAVVEQDRQRRAAAAGRIIVRIPDRPCGRQYHQRCRQQAQGGQPPRRS